MDTLTTSRWIRALDEALGVIAWAWGVRLDAPAGLPGAAATETDTTMQPAAAGPTRRQRPPRGPLAALEVTR